MERVSTNMPNNDTMFWLRLRQLKMNTLQNQMSSQNRIQNLREDPIGAAHATRFESRLTRLKRYEKNVNWVIDRNNYADGYLKSATDIMQRIRNLAVQGANGTYTKPDLRKMGQEVNQLLNQLIQLANAHSPDGNMLFAGERNQSAPYRVLKGTVPGAGGKVVTNVEYTGSIGQNKVQVGDGTTIPENLPGNRIFWAEQQQIFSNVNASTYHVQQDSTISIDGTTINLKAGDNVYAIIAKINNAGAGVRARLDPVKNSLVLQTTTPHQIWVRDVGNSSVLKDLGIIGSTNGAPPHNIASSAQVSGGSLFDMVIALRNDLYQGKTISTGGSGLQGIDAGLNNLLTARAQLGSINERMKNRGQLISAEIPQVTQQLSRLTGIDMAKAITDLKMLQYTYQAALQTAGKVLPPTLMDFLR